MEAAKARRPGSLQGAQEGLRRRCQRARVGLRRSAHQASLSDHPANRRPRKTLSGQHSQLRPANDAGGGQHESRHGGGIGARRGRTGIASAFQSSRNFAASLGRAHRPCPELAESQAAPKSRGFHSPGSLRSQESPRRSRYSRLAKELSIGKSSRQGAKTSSLEEKDKSRR